MLFCVVSHLGLENNKLIFNFIKQVKVTRGTYCNLFCLFHCRMFKISGSYPLNILHDTMKTSSQFLLCPLEGGPVSLRTPS